MKWFLLATMCLPGAQEDLCIRMHGDMMYDTGELCAVDRNNHFTDLVYITQEYRGTFKIQCVDSFSIEEFLGKQK